MKLLLDTHILLWWLADSEELSKKGRTLISDNSNVVFYSAATVWELRIKEAVGKVSLPRQFYSVLLDEPFEKLSITVEHANGISRLPDIHRDPFDRILLSQAVSEDLTLLTHDKLLAKYRSADVILI